MTTSDKTPSGEPRRVSAQQSTPNPRGPANEPAEPHSKDRTTVEAPPILDVQDPKVKMTWFLDPDAEFRARFKDHLFSDLEEMKARLKKQGLANVGHATLGGWKVRGQETWDSEEARRIKEQVLQFVKTTYNQEHVHLRDRWANVMEEGKGWYSVPHSHQTDVAVVYLLDDGGVPDDEEAGRLHIIDPRIPFCCPGRPEHATRLMTPMIPEQGVILFPGFINHWVSPFFGTAPRVTLAFNVGLGPAPPGLDESQMEDQVLHPKGGSVM